MDRTDYIHVRDDLMRAEVTLDGKPAHISGRLLPYAVVWQVPPDGDLAQSKDVQFSWAAVARVVAGGGAFKS